MLNFGGLSRLATIGTLAVLGCLAAVPPAEALYDVQPGEIPGRPGTIIRIWPLEGGGPSLGGNANAFRFLYRSTGLNGQPIPVSGAIFIPSGPAPAGGRNIIAWAHPTSGVMPPCAPSLMPDTAGMIWNLAEMLSRGYVVVATDYPGLGTDGIHPYLIGESEGRAVLDSVRAARDLPDSGASDRFAVWGHSQGGHAALYTGELAARYAPDLKLVGVAAAAPATYLVQLFDADSDDRHGKGLDLDGAPLLDKARERAGRRPWSSRRPCRLSKRPHETASNRCPSSRPSRRPRSPCKREQFLKVDPSRGASPGGGSWSATRRVSLRPERRCSSPKALPIRRCIRRSPSVSAKRSAPKACAVSFVELPGVTHTFAARDSAAAAINWMTERFRGAPAPSDCER